VRAAAGTLLRKGFAPCPHAAEVPSPVPALQRRLAAVASPAAKAWWERYLRGEAKFRGVGIPAIRAEVAAWRSETLDGASPEEQFAVALDLLAEGYTEDQLAGVLLMQDHLRDALPWRVQVDGLAMALAAGNVRDWNVCDWLAVRVPGPLIAAHGAACARAVAAWTDASNLWQARCGLVAFVNLLGEQEHQALVLRGAARLLAREERFAKTAAGWALRELSRHDPKAAARFVEAHAADFSAEAFANATKRLPAATTARLRALVPPARPATPRTLPVGRGRAGPPRRTGGRARR
jgi:3-methyladenine DNA glycosylase AlkD